MIHDFISIPLYFLLYFFSIFFFFFFFFNDTATTEIYTLSLHDALPISWVLGKHEWCTSIRNCCPRLTRTRKSGVLRSEEHTSELQSRQYLVCRLLLEKKKNKKNKYQ